MSHICLSEAAKRRNFDVIVLPIFKERDPKFLTCVWVITDLVATFGDGRRSGLRD